MQQLWDRRAVLAAAAASAVSPALAQGSAATLAVGPLAGNPVAEKFVLAPAGMKLPDIVLMGTTGRRRLSEFRGRSLLIPLWAEWCAPCLVEMPDFAALHERHESANFAVMPVLTSSRKKWTPDAVKLLLSRMKAERFEPLMELDGRNQLSQALAHQPGKPRTQRSLPCNLLVDRTGRVVARQFGAMGVRLDGDAAGAPSKGAGRPTSVGEARRREMMMKAQVGGSTAWASPAAHAFAAALAGGLLDRV